MPVIFSSRGMTWGHRFDPLSIRLNQVLEILLFEVSRMQPSFILDTTTCLFFRRIMRWVALDWSSLRNADCSCLLTRYIILLQRQKLQIGYSIMSLCRIHVYYDVVNVLWAHRNKIIWKLHMHRGLKDFLNLFFSLFFSICANVFSFILLSFPWFCKKHWTNNSEQVHASLELIRFLMVDFLFNFTTKFFDTNLPKLWPINTIGQCHLYLHKTYSFAILNFEEIFNWFLHFILVKSIFMCD
jgi:hypothetical protein